jgi:hypothetical protein
VRLIAGVVQSMRIRSRYSRLCSLVHIHSGVRACTFPYMAEQTSPGVFAEWERAMVSMRVAERQLEAALARKADTLVPAMRAELEALRTRADLLLAHAIKAIQLPPETQQPITSEPARSSR